MVPNMNSEDRSIVRRATVQRKLVLEAVCRGDHPTAKEIFEAVSQPKWMSFGTVYRNLQILAQEGVISSLQADREAVRYDKRVDKHHHLHCRMCNKVFDVPIPYKDAFNKEISKNSGFVVESHSITFEGLCHECAGREAQ
jgi:Fe2+ or Zn2+ uptake regulation protein